MQATVAADKRYYAVIAPIWPAQWFLRPVRKQNSTFLLSSKEVASLMKKTKYVELEPDEVSAEKAAKVAEAYKERWPKWQAKDAGERDMLTLHAEDSVN